MRGLAAARGARVGKMLEVSPHRMSQISQGTPRTSAAGAMNVDHRFGAQVADAGMEAHPALAA